MEDPATKRQKPGTPPDQQQQQQPQARMTIDLTKDEEAVVTPVSRRPQQQQQQQQQQPLPPKEKEELEEEEEEEEEEDDTSKKSGKKKSPTLSDVSSAQTTLENKISLLKTRLERLFAVSFALAKSTKEQELTAATIVEWADDSYGPQRTIEEIDFKGRYGGVDAIARTAESGSRYKIKTPLSTKKVQCVPYYLLAEQVQKNTRLLKAINERLLPALDPAIYEIALTQKTFFDRNLPTSAREYAEKTGGALPPTFPLLAAPARLRNIPDKQLGKGTGILGIPRNASLQKAEDERELTQQQEDTRKAIAAQAKAQLESDAAKLKASFSLPSSSSSSKEQQKQQSSQEQQKQQSSREQRPPDVQSLPENWSELETEEKLDALTARYYEIWSLLKWRFVEMDRKSADFDARIAALEAAKLAPPPPPGADDPYAYLDFGPGNDFLNF